METDNNVPKRHLISRLSKMQKDILAHLAAAPQPTPSPRGDGMLIGHLSRTGDIIDALGRERTPSNYAAVSKALDRLNKRGLINAHRAQCCLVGKGYRYAVNPDAHVFVQAA
ncbi:helix-turn-helix domain-containing protein [Bradyrhizobium sp. Leo121]|uniref:MarR family transcriptional regulator n=1 Tax=Bradyrhizobium sp. Leo121 TaxID=1571195 RepID=UPI0010290B3D|nr:helix-turn-helix domain-containing protein [Bradyrhizobium sp. Leo121]